MGFGQPCGGAEDGEELGDEDEEDMDGSKSTSSETILRDFNYKLRCMFMERNRNLRVTGAQCSALYVESNSKDYPQCTVDKPLWLNNKKLKSGEASDGDLRAIFYLWEPFGVSGSGAGDCQRRKECCPQVFAVEAGVGSWGVHAAQTGHCETMQI